MQDKKELFQALRKFQDETVYVKATTEGHHGKYATYKDVVLASKDGLKSNGLIIQQAVSNLDGKSTIETLLIHLDTGQALASTQILAYQGEDAQKQGSSITYAKRYSYVTILGLLVDTDDDGALASVANDTKIEEAKQKLGKSKSIQELKKNYMSLGTLISNKEVIAFKNELKDLLEANEEPA